MTEAEWLTSNDLTRMLIYLRGDVEPPESDPDTRPRLLSKHGALVFGDGKRVTSRRLARFAQEVCKKWWKLPLDEISGHLILSYERFLGGEGSWQEFWSACSRVSDAATAEAKPVINTLSFWPLNPYGMANLTEDLAWVTACHLHRDRIEELERTASEDERFVWRFFGYDFPEFGATARAIRNPLPDLLREIIGNPFRPASLNPAWLIWNSGTVQKLAHSIDDELAFDRLPLLADALEEAGCQDQELLGHCRSGGEHVRGCWLVDLLLGKK